MFSAILSVPRQIYSERKLPGWPDFQLGTFEQTLEDVLVTKLQLWMIHRETLMKCRNHISREVAQASVRQNVARAASWTGACKCEGRVYEVCLQHCMCTVLVFFFLLVLRCSFFSFSQSRRQISHQPLSYFSRMIKKETFHGDQTHRCVYCLSIVFCQVVVLSVA